MIKYYLGVTGLVWVMYALAIIFNKFIYKRKLAFKKYDKNEKIQNFIEFTVRSFIPFVRIILIWSTYKLITMSDKELQDMIDKFEL